MNPRRFSLLRTVTACLAVAAWLVLLTAPAGAQTTSATLIGKVQDGQGQALPGVTVTVKNKETGLERTETTAADGTFRVGGLPAGVYSVAAELSGFATVNVDEVRLNVATDRNLEVTMNQASLEESITVVDEAPLVATDPSIGTVVSQEELESLPLNGRQFANLATLAPGTTLSYNADPTKPGQQTVALNGGIGRNVNYVIDGGDNTDDTIGGALQNFNLESVQEFKIQTMQYKAEFGRSSGGVLSVVTKTGTNKFEGSAYEFRRDDKLNTRTESERLAGAEKAPYQRDQYGASLGGPIVRDKAHFFATYEKTDRPSNYTINTGGIFPSLDGTSVAIPFTDELITAKATYDISARQYLQVRYGYQKNDDKYGANPLTTPTALGTLTNEYDSILLGHTWQVGADSLNEAIVQVTNFKNSILADSNDPSLIFPSGVTSGQNGNTPQTTEQEKRQFRDDFSWSQTLWNDRHDFKVGINYIDEPKLLASFTTGTAGAFTLRDNNVNSPVTDITFTGGFAGVKTPTEQKSAYAQDDWQLTDRFTLNLGLRYDLYTGFDIDQRANPIWQTLATQTTFNEYFLRDFQGGRGGKLENDTNNYGPRIGFVWDFKGDGRQLLRGGYGRYFDFPYTNATILFPAVAFQSNFGVIYNVNDPNGIRNPNGTFYRPGVDPLPPNGLSGAVLNPPNEVGSPTLAAPQSTQASLGYSWQVNNWLGLNFEAVTIDYEKIPFRMRGNPFIGPNGQPQSTRRFPDFGNFRIWYGNGEASYDGFNLGVRARLTNCELQGFYTLSRAEGNVLAGADEFRITDGNYQPDIVGAGRGDVSVNPIDPLCDACFGPLNTDARHRITLAGTYRAPLGLNLSGVLRYRSATPYTERAGVDLNGDRFLNDLAPGVSHVNTRRGAAFSQFDLRLSKEFRFVDRFGIELIGEVFNVFNRKNPAGFIGDRTAPNFGQPTTYAGDPLQGEQRLGQLGVRVRF
jgi:hypothetical protein